MRCGTEEGRHAAKGRELGVLLDELAEERCGVLAELAVVRTERGEEGGIDVEFADDFAVSEDRDDDFGLGFERTGQIAGIGVDVVDDDGFPAGSGSTANTLVERDAGVGRHGALERAENQNVLATFLFEHIKADPIVAGEFFVEERDDALHEGLGVVRGDRERVELWNEVGGLVDGGGHGSS